MKLSELQQALRAADPAAVLVPSRVLDRILQQVYGPPGLFRSVPHRDCCVLDRQVLFRHVEQEELALEPDQLLPSTVLLLAQPSAEELNERGPGPLLLRGWRNLFHASVHRLLDARATEGKLSPEEVRDRIEQLGRTEFDEARTVLVQDGYLPPSADERSIYIEFAAVYLELRHFEPELLPACFPALLDPARVDRLLACDLDAGALFAQTRPPGAPDPTSRPGDLTGEAHEYYWKLIRGAEQEARAGNSVRAAILRRRAARVAPAGLASGTREAAVAELSKLGTRLQAALQMSDAEAAEWGRVLPILLDKADQGSRPVEAALLFDLQKLCVDHERNLYALDVVEWLLSAGKRPIKRPLPGQRLVRITRHLRHAAQRLATARLSDADRQHLGGLLQAALRHSEEGLRSRFRPLLIDALHTAGLEPNSPPEQTAFQKMVEELLDRIAGPGFITFGDLRDTISRNQLKLPDLRDPQDFIRGDPLLRLDRRLATLLDGIYRPGEIYMRWLERLSSLSFGTATGRWLTRYVLVPFGGAFVVVEGINRVLDSFGSTPLPSAVSYAAMLWLGVFLLGLLHSSTLRRRCAQLAVRAVRPARAVFVAFPTWLVSRPWLRRVTESWAFQLFVWFLLKPLLVCNLLALRWPELFMAPDRRGLGIGAVAIPVGVTLLLHSRPGRAAGELLNQALYRLYELLRAGLLPGLFRLVVSAFKRLTELVEAGLFHVDEWLWFRSGDHRLIAAARAVAGILWFPVAYLARFYVVVLVEPGINPIKFPISSIATKFIYPLTLPFVQKLVEVLAPALGSLPAQVIVATTFFLLPDAVGFLVWETKENWSLYRANRARTLRPSAVGPRGETVRRLLEPAFHSGTVPRLYARLRRAERAASHSGNWRAARQARAALDDVAQAVRRFVERELVVLLHQDPAWAERPLRVGQVTLGCTSVLFELRHAGFPDQPIKIGFEERAGWLVAGVREPGWLGELTSAQRQTFAAALTALYQLAGIDLVQEQVSAALPSSVASWELTAAGLVLRLGSAPERTIAYDLRVPDGEAWPSATMAEVPALDARQLVFARTPLSWEQWASCWEKDRNGSGLSGLPSESSSRVLPPGPAVSSPVKSASIQN